MNTQNEGRVVLGLQHITAVMLTEFGLETGSMSFPYKR